MEYKIWCQFKYRQHFPIQILLVFLRFKLLPNFILYRPQTWQFYLFFLLSLSAIHEVLGIKLRVLGHVTLRCKRPIMDMTLLMDVLCVS